MILYNPQKDCLLDLIPLHTEENDGILFDDYKITYYSIRPVAYILCFDENESGILVSSELIQQQINNGILIEI